VPGVLSGCPLAAFDSHSFETAFLSERARGGLDLAHGCISLDMRTSQDECLALREHFTDESSLALRNVKGSDHEIALLLKNSDTTLQL
jgi:hypothetical protein